MSIKRDYKTKTDDGMELEPLGGPKSPEKEKSNGVQFGKYESIMLLLFVSSHFCFFFLSQIKSGKWNFYVIDCPMIVTFRKVN